MKKYNLSLDLDLFEFVTLKVAVESYLEEKRKTLKVFTESEHDFDLSLIEKDIEASQFLYHQLELVQGISKKP